MANVIDSSSQRFPGVVTEYAIFHRKASQRDPNGWALLGRPTTEHQTLREMIMPDSQLDSNLYGVGWIDPYSDVEYKILQRTVTRSDWVVETKSKVTINTPA